MLVIKWMTKSGCGRTVTLVRVHGREFGGALTLVSTIDICSVGIVWVLWPLILEAGRWTCLLVTPIAITVLTLVLRVCGIYRRSRLGDRSSWTRGKEISRVWRILGIRWGSDIKVFSSYFVFWSYIRSIHPFVIWVIVCDSVRPSWAWISRRHDNFSTLCSQRETGVSWKIHKNGCACLSRRQTGPAGRTMMASWVRLPLSTVHEWQMNLLITKASFTFNSFFLGHYFFYIQHYWCLEMSWWIWFAL